MEIEIKFTSIIMRWLFEVFLIVAAAVTVAATIFCVVLDSMYMERVESMANDYAYDFSALSKTDQKTFKSTAVTLSETYAYKDKIEVQVMDSEGNVIVTTTGFDAETADKEIYKTAAGESGKYFICKTALGEEIMACNNDVYDKSGNFLGSYRWITSLTQVNEHILFMIIITVLVALGMLGLCFVSGFFFIKSIVRPIRNVSSTARKIALGDFKNTIETDKNDEIGELCETINYMAGELSSAEEMKNDFISSVSHELRTPLTAICGWGETVRGAIGNDDELVGRGVDVMLSEADRLSGLVEELLDFSRMQNGRLVVNSMSVDVSTLLGSAVDMYTELARRQGIELVFARPTRTDTVLGDPDRLKQVFINIIDNAVKYTESGGQVLIEQRLEEACVRIIVKDTGVGIPEQDIDHVKEKFFKSNKTVRGTGIGLAVADEIIKQHQGLLFLESTEGVGTTVTIVLPLYEEVIDDKREEEKVSLEEIVETEIEEKADEMIKAEQENQTSEEMTAEEMVEQMKAYPELTEEQIKMFGPDSTAEIEPEHLDDISPEELALVEAELEAEAQKAAQMNLSDGAEIPAE